MKYLIGNWKANHEVDSTRAFLTKWQELLHEDKLSSELLVSIAPPAVLYPIFLAKAKELNLPILAALQNISEFNQGAHTGEVVLENLAGIEPSLCLVGHSERRANGETNEQVALKVEKLLAAQIVPVLCVDDNYIESQAALLKPEFYDKLIVAYEDKNAISDGTVRTGNDNKNLTSDAVIPILERCRRAFPGCKVLYGGSVNASNITEYVTISDGVLVGGASLEADNFFQIAKQM
jgi:triosephosphate isomerase